MARQSKDNFAFARSETSDNTMSQLYMGMIEKTVRESSMWPDSYDNPYNSDDLVQKDWAYKVYEDMGRDEQVHVALELKKDLVLNSGWDIVVEDDDQEEIREDLLQALGEDIESPLEEQLHEVLSAYKYGFSISEKLFQRRPDGSLSFKALRTRHPSTWRLEQDKYGAVSKYIQITSDGEIKVNPKSIIHYVNNKSFQNPYGISDLRPAYTSYVAKQQIMRYMGIFSEKYASPIPVARYDKSAPQSAVDKIFAIIKKFQQKTAIAIPKEIEIEFLEASKSGGDFYVKVINMLNMFIGRALFVPDLLGLSGSETSGGSFSLGEEQIGIYAKHINKRRAIIEQIVNQHIIKPIVIHNWGFVDNFPKFKLNQINDKQTMEAAKTWISAVSGLNRAYVPSEAEVNHFRSLIKFPEGDVEVERQPGNQPNNPNEPDEPSDEMPEDLPEEVKDEAMPMNPKDEEKMSMFAKDSAYPTHEGDYYKKTDFSKIELEMNNALRDIMAKSHDVVKYIYEDIYNQIKKKKIIESKDASLLNTINIPKLKELNIIFKTAFKDLYRKGKEIAANEVIKGNFADMIVDEEFLQLLDEEVFNFIGKYRTNIESDMKVKIIEAIKSGESISAVEGQFIINGTQMSDTQIERFARTKTTEVMNKARLAFFNDSDLIIGYQFSAVMDSLTTPICSGLHNKYFEKGKEPVPPLHFNCRSTLIPITKYDTEFEETVSVNGVPTDQFIAQNVGEGFPAK